jgi:hypothetical protein
VKPLVRLPLLIVRVQLQRDENADDNQDEFAEGIAEVVEGLALAKRVLG